MLVEDDDGDIEPVRPTRAAGQIIWTVGIEMYSRQSCMFSQDAISNMQRASHLT